MTNQEVADRTAQLIAYKIDQKSERTDTRQPEFHKDDYLPQFVIDRINDVSQEMPQMYVPEGIDATEPEIRDWLGEELEEDYDLDTLAIQFADDFDVNEGWAYKHLRDWTSILVNVSRLERYSEMDVDFEDKKFKWVGPKDDVNHPACIWLSNKTENGVKLWQLENYIEEARRKFVEDPPPNPYIVHEWCRHQIKQA